MSPQRSIPSDCIPSDWHAAMLTPPLAAHQVHIWKVALTASDAALRAYRRLLTPEELARADRFYFPDLRLKFAVTRGVLRQLMGQYLGVPPEAPRFRNGPHGKPELDPSSQPAPTSARSAGMPANARSLEFNISHSGEWALMAFAWDMPLGVDLEQQKGQRDFDGLARHSFSPAELAVWQALPTELKVVGFFNAWSRKEAFIKALGMGLYRSLKSFDVSLDPAVPMQLLACRPDPHEVNEWRLVPLPDVSGFSTALCLPSHAFLPPDRLTMTCLEWIPSPPYL